MASDINNRDQRQELTVLAGVWLGKSENNTNEPRVRDSFVQAQEKLPDKSSPLFKKLQNLYQRLMHPHHPLTAETMDEIHQRLENLKQQRTLY
jgi:hypothetical protein